MIRIGQIVNTHGNKGEVKVYPLTNDAKRFKKLTHAYLELPGNKYEKVHPISAREHKNSIILGLKEVEDMNQAERLKSVYLCIDEEQLVKLPKNHFFIFDIIGLDVVEEDGKNLGKVKDVIQTAGNDVYLVSDGKREFCLPALKSVVKQIDLDTKTMTIQLPLGLLD